MEIYLPDTIREYVEGKPFVSDSIGMSDSSVLTYDDMVLKIQNGSADIENEHKMMNWLKNKLPAPQCIDYCFENGRFYLLMTRISGKMACDDEYLNNPKELVSILTDSLRILWDTDVSDCPVRKDLSTKLSEAEYRVEHGLVDVDDAEPGTFGANGFKDPGKLLGWLLDNRPEEDFVLSHGDFCLPNIFIKDDRLSGFVDIGRMGISDRWQDIALCVRSLEHNSSGRYGGKAYTGFSEKLFFDSLGMTPEKDKIRYYILLDELF